jgi:hypothetical protein
MNIPTMPTHFVEIEGAAPTPPRWILALHVPGAGYPEELAVDIASGALLALERECVAAAAITVDDLSTRLPLFYLSEADARAVAVVMMRRRPELQIYVAPE